MTENILVIIRVAVGAISAILVVIGSMILAHQFHLEVNVIVMAITALAAFILAPRAVAPLLALTMPSNNPRKTKTDAIGTNYVSLESMQLDTQGLTPLDSAPSQKQWEDESPKHVSVFCFNLAPDIPASLSDVETIKEKQARHLEKTGGHLVSCDVGSLNGFDCLTTILKIPQKPHGMTYIGSVIIPFRDFSFVIKVQCPEVGTTGMREALLVARMWENGKSTEDVIKEAGIFDSVEYDSEFPDHPLSRVRQFLDELPGKVKFDPELKKAARFEGPS